MSRSRDTDGYKGPGSSHRARHRIAGAKKFLLSIIAMVGIGVLFFVLSKRWRERQAEAREEKREQKMQSESAAARRMPQRASATAEQASVEDTTSDSVELTKPLIARLQKLKYEDLSEGLRHPPENHQWRAIGSPTENTMAIHKDGSMYDYNSRALQVQNHIVSIAHHPALPDEVTPTTDFDAIVNSRRPTDVHVQKLIFDEMRYQSALLQSGATGTCCRFFGVAHH